MSSKRQPIALDYRITLRGILTLHADQAFHSSPILTRINMSEQLPDQVLIPISDAIKMLEKAGRQIMSLSQHPVDASLVAIEHHQFKQLEVVLARIPPKQMHIDSVDMHHAEKIEVQETERVLKKMAPIADKIIQKKITAEQVMSTIHNDAQPGYAKKVLKTLITSGNVFVTNEQSTGSIADSQGDTSFKAKGDSIHELVIDITQINLAERKIDAILLRAVSTDSYFHAEQVSRPVIHLKISDAANMFCLLQAASLNWSIQVRIQTDIQFKQNKMIYNGVLVDIPNHEDLLQSLQAAATQKQRELFES